MHAADYTQRGPDRVTKQDEQASKIQACLVAKFPDESDISVSFFVGEFSIRFGKPIKYAFRYAIDNNLGLQYNARLSSDDEPDQAFKDKVASCVKSVITGGRRRKRNKSKDTRRRTRRRATQRK